MTLCWCSIVCLSWVPSIDLILKKFMHDRKYGKQKDKILWTRISKVMWINCKVFRCLWGFHASCHEKYIHTHMLILIINFITNISSNLISIDDICFESNVLIIFKFQWKINSALFNITPYDRKLRKNNEIYVAS